MIDYKKLQPINFDKIKLVDFPKDHYYQEEFNKTQVVLHHTVSNPDSIEGDLKTWLSKPSHIATAFIIASDGTPYQCFPSKYWAYHLGLQKSTFDKNNLPYKPIDKNSIGIEIDNWGGLYLGDGVTIKDFGTPEAPRVIRLEKGKYYTAYGNIIKVDEKNISYYPDGFRGYKYFCNYTEAQIQTVAELLLFFKNKYGIPLKYNDDMWDVSKRALSGEPGVWAHCSFRYDKSDVHPCSDLISMLKQI